MVVTDFVKIVD